MIVVMMFIRNYTIFSDTPIYGMMFEPARDSISIRIESGYLTTLRISSMDFDATSLAKCCTCIGIIKLTRNLKLFASSR